MKSLAASVVLLTSLVAGAPQAAKDYSYAAAYKEAQETGRPLVVLVGADWCSACQTMKQSVIPAVSRQGGLDNVAFAIVNTDRESRIASRLMSGSSIPQLVTYRKTEGGWKRTQMTGAQSASRVVSHLNQIVELAAQERGDQHPSEDASATLAAH